MVIYSYVEVAPFAN